MAQRLQDADDMHLVCKTCGDKARFNKAGYVLCPRCTGLVCPFEVEAKFKWVVR